jgi:hypothetical protein
MMLAADRIAANVLAATPRRVTRSTENTSVFQKSGSGRMAQPNRKRLTIGLNRWRGV